MKRRMLYISASLLIAFVAHNVEAQGGRPAVGDKALTHMSQSVAIRYWLAHPEQAPVHLQQRFRQARQTAAQARGRSGTSRPHVAGLFNLDTFGLPQNEESVTACRPSTSVVLGGTNDFRGLFLDPEGNFTGWHLSTDDGANVANEGFLPSVEIAGKPVPSGGDPVVAADGRCRLFAGSLNDDPFDPFTQPNGVGVYKSDPATLASCPGGSDPSCWPTRRAVAVAEPPHFLDKEWLDVGKSGPAGVVVWVVYTNFVLDPSAPAGFTSASINAVRCDADLVSCTSPILISDNDQDVQFGDVTIGQDGRTYITWSEIQGELEGTAQTFIHKLRIAPAGSLTFGPTRVVATEELPLPFGGFLHANDFRTATYPKNEVALVGGRPRVFVVWDACQARPLDTICEEPQIKLTYSDDDGGTWTEQKILSVGNDNYFPTISSDSAGRLAVAWYTNSFDPNFHNRQDVELVTLNASTAAVTKRMRISLFPNETEADPVLGGFFIGDYIEVFADQGTAYVHYNANYRQIELLGLGFPVNQQDNFMVKTRLVGE